MTAADTLPSTPATPDQRAYEPSMEEILASIRRIIADDQSLPNRFARDDEANLRAALEAAAPKPEMPGVPQPVAPEPHVAEAPPVLRGAVDAPAMPAAPAMPKAATMPPRIVATAPHGHIAAPQFAMPDTPTLRGIAQPKRGPDSEADSAVLHFTAPVAPAPQPSYQQPIPAQPAPARETSASKAEAPVADPLSNLFSSATDQAVTAAFNTLAATRILESDDMLKDMVRDIIRPLLKTWLDENLPSMVERLVRAEIERVSRGGR